jgi:UDP-2,4-diacetamido-2,4,6-trideoxy-beta-L-altropyranose hydrolase
MNVFFRVDASNLIGTGHLMRCLTLAEALRVQGAETRFICREHPGNMIEHLQKQSMPVKVLPTPIQPLNVSHAEDYAAYLGVTKTEDAEQTVEALDGDRPDWLIVDHYGLDADWEQRLRPHVARLMVIDDLANRSHDCDLLLDQNRIDGGTDSYQGLVPENCCILLGPRFALLKPEYAAYRRTLRPHDGEVRRVLVFFGGSDRHNMTALALEALCASEFAHLEVDVVVGANNQYCVQLEQQAISRPLTCMYGPRPHLADLMSQADIAIGAGGATTWERMCLGLPSLVITLAKNQIPLSDILDKLGLIRLVGHADNLCVAELRKSLFDEIESHQYKSRSTSGMDLCDGTGALQVVEALLKESKMLCGNKRHVPSEIGGIGRR